MLSLDQWIALFDTKDITRSEFKQTFKVRKSNGSIIPITQDHDFLYDAFVTHKIRYLTNFYQRSLKTHEVNLKPKDITFNNNTNAKFKNVIRNIHLKGILIDTKTIQPNIRNFLEVILDLFKHRIVDYKLVTPSSLALIEKNKLSSILSGYYFRSSIMNPTIPFSVSTHMTKPFNVFTPTLGWSSYLYGMMSNPLLKHYVGVDVLKNVCQTTKSIASENKIKSNIYCHPSEDLLKSKSFLKTYDDYFDFVFFSPPYYQLEMYEGEQQSTTRYKSYEEWLDGYWRQTMKLCHHVLKDDHRMYYIISGYKNKSKFYDLETDMNRICQEEGFVFQEQIPMTNKNVGFTKHRTASENIYVFRKTIKPKSI